MSDSQNINLANFPFYVDVWVLQRRILRQRCDRQTPQEAGGRGANLQGVRVRPLVCEKQPPLVPDDGAIWPGH